MSPSWALSWLLAASCAAEDFTQSHYVSLALTSSPEAAAAREVYLSASSQFRAAVGDAWLPSLSATGSAAPYGYNPANSNTYNTWRLNDSDVTYNLSASMNLFNSFLDWRKIRQSRLSREAARVNWDAARQARAFEAFRTYLDLYLKQKLKEVAQADESAQKSQYELTQDLYRNGMKSRSDLLKSQTDWRSSELRALGAEADRKKSLYHFNLLVGRPVEASASLAELAPPPAEAVKPEDALQRAESRRNEIKKTRLDVRQSDLSVGQATQDLFPRLAASANWTESRPATFGDPALSGRQRPYYYLALTLSLPVGFNAYGQFEKSRSARADLRRSRAELSALLRRVREEVHFSRIDLEQALRSYQVSLEREALAKDNLDLVAQQYRQGSADVIRLAEARRDYLQARTEMYRLLHDTQLRWTEYRQAIGANLWEP